MFLPLLGACAVVGPFQGAEWEPVQGLLSEDRSCRNLRCWGNLLVLCLFVIWQAQHYWHHNIRTCSNKKKVIKVPSKNWAVSSASCDIYFDLAPEFLVNPDQLRELDTHVQQRAQEKTEEHGRTLQESQTQYLLSQPKLCQEPPQGVLTCAEPMFCGTSFPNTCMASQDNSWEAGQVPWCLSDGQTCKPLAPALEVCQRLEQLLVHAQEEFMPLQPVVSLRSQPTAMTLATSLTKFPATQRVQVSSRELLPSPSNQKGGIPTTKFCSCLHEASKPGRENQIQGREEDSRQTQAVVWVKQRESVEENAWEIKANGKPLPVDRATKEAAEIKVLEWGSERLVINKAGGEFLTPRWQRHDQMEAEPKANIQELGERNLRETAGETSSEAQKPICENQEELRGKTDAATQTSGWGSQEMGRNEDAAENRALENSNGTRGEDEEDIQTQGLRKQGQPGNGSGTETQAPEQRKLEQIQGDTGTEIQVEEWGSKDRAGGKKTLQTQIAGKDNLHDVKKDDGIETHTLEWGRQGCTGGEKVSENKGHGRREKAGKIHASREEVPKHRKHELQMGLGNQGLRREGARETQVSRKKNLMEVKEEDWVVIQALWWEDHKLVVSKIVRGPEVPSWGNQDQAVGKCLAEIQASEDWNQRKDGGEDSTDTWAPEAESQGQVRGETHVEIYPPWRRNQEQLGGENSADIEALGQQKPREVGDEKEAWELGAENQSHTSNGIIGKIHTLDCENQEHIKGKDNANTQTSRAEDCRESIGKTEEETQPTEWGKEKQPGSENGTEIQALEKRHQRESGGQEAWPRQEESRSQRRGDNDGKTHLFEWKNQEHVGSEDEAEIRTPERRNQRETINKDGTETQSPETENQDEVWVSYSPGRKTWGQTEGKKNADNQALEKRNQRAVGNDDDRKIRRLRGGNQKVVKSQVDGRACSPDRQQMGAENGAEVQGKKGDSRDDKMQAPGQGDQKESRNGCDGDMQRQGKGNEGKSREEDDAEIHNEGNQTKCRAEEVGGSEGNKGQSRAKDVARDSVHIEHSGSEMSPILPNSRHGTVRHEQAVTSVCCPDMTPLSKPGEVILLAGGEGHHLAKQSRAPARRHRAEVSVAFQESRPKPLRRRHRNKEVGPGKGSNLTPECQKPQSQAAPLALPPSASSSVTALVDIPIAHSAPPKWPILKRSQRLLLESLMRRKIAHLKWGPPQRILESHLLSSFLGTCPPPFVGMRLLGNNTGREQPEQQEGHREAQGSTPALKFSQRPRRACPPERKSSKLPPQARAPDKRGSCGTGPVGVSTPLEKPRRARPPPGGSREPQTVQEAVPPRAKLTAPRNLRLAAESRRPCNPERAREPSSENSRGRETVRPGASQKAARAPSRVQISQSVGHEPPCQEHTFQKVTLPPRCTWKQPTVQTRSQASEEGRGAGHQPSFCSTDTFNLKGSLHSAASRLGTALLGKLSCCPHLAKPQHSTPNLSQRTPGSSLKPQGSNPPPREDIMTVNTSFKKDPQPVDQCCTGATINKIQRPQDPRVLVRPHKAPQNPPVSPKFGFVKHLRYFLLQHGFRK